VLVSLMCVLGVFGWLERPTLDWRARWFGNFSPGASRDLVIVGIDDQAISSVQRWPWDRVHLADAVREIRRAGAKVIALDILLEESQGPQRDEWFETGNEVDGDAALAQAISHPDIVLPIRLRPREREDGGEIDSSAQMTSAAMRRILQEYNADLIANEPYERVQARVREIVALEAPGAAMFDRDKVGAAAWEAAAWLARHMPTCSFTPGDSKLRLPMATTAAPIASSLRGVRVGAIGDVSGDAFDSGGVMRSVPLVAMFADRAWPSLGVAAGAMFVDADASALRVERTSSGT